MSEAIADTTGRRLVGCVLNTIDDALDKADPGRATWQVSEIAHLRALLDAANQAGRAVVVTSDHGHVVERRDTEHRPAAGADSARSRREYLAAATERVELASGVLQLYTRTPTLTAMTAAGLDYVSDGRYILGLGASGPQVIEGFHGVPYDSPIGRTREVVEICRQVWRRERLAYQGKHYTIPLPEGQGTGLGKSLKLINHPVRERIPVLLAALGMLGPFSIDTYLPAFAGIARSLGATRWQVLRHVTIPSALPEVIENALLGLPLDPEQG